MREFQFKRQKSLANRRLFIIDIENAVGSGLLTPELVAEESQRIKETHNFSENDIAVLGVSHSANVFPASEWQNARIVLGQGHNGADYALKNVLACEQVEKRFQSIILVSGDGIFTEDVQRLKDAGLKVVVDTTTPKASKALAHAASIVFLTLKNELEAYSDETSNSNKVKIIL